jgi:predicted Zn-dependent protease with MMP-like domain
MLTNEEFENLVRQGIDSIDERFLQKLKNVEIIVEDSPTPFQIEKLKLRGALLFGLYEGIPQTKREGYGQVLPDKITIFKNPIEQVYFRPEDIKRAVKNTVWHEIAHHFGMDEKQVRQAEIKRR